MRARTRTREPARRVAVLGLGNVLMADDAVGPYVARVIEAHWELPVEVSVADLGTPGLDLTPHLSGLDAAIIVDTVVALGRTGELRLYRRDRILEHLPAPRVHPHAPALKEALLALEFAGTGPREVLLIGVIPERVDAHVGLSPGVREALPAIEAEVVRELERLGVRVSRRAAPMDPQIWWEAPAAQEPEAPITR